MSRKVPGNPRPIRSGAARDTVSPCQLRNTRIRRRTACAASSSTCSTTIRAPRHAPEQLAERLNHDDRWARARARYPLDTDDELAGKLGEFDDRITLDEVRTARDRVRPADD